MSAGYKCVCLNTRTIVNKNNELNIMVKYIKLHLIGITESWANKDISDAESRLIGYIIFSRARIERIYIVLALSPSELSGIPVPRKYTMCWHCQSMKCLWFATSAWFD